MACKGCQGIEICDAALCCIGFEQDCGQGCTGLAIGESRIQVSATGSLEICSNVGGSCDCKALCTDCFTAILSDNDCVNGGIGSDYMINEATLASGVLTLNGAPEHYGVGGDDSFTVVDGGNPATGVGNRTVTHSQGGIFILNPSNCRDMQVHVATHANYVIRLMDLNVAFSLSLTLVSGLGATLNSGFVQTIQPTVDFPSDIAVQNGVSCSGVDVLGPGVGTNYYYILNSTVQNPLEGFDEFRAVITLSVYGTTV